MCGSPCARCPPSVATLRTRTFDSVRSVFVMTGQPLRTDVGLLERAQRRHRADAQRAVRCDFELSSCSFLRLTRRLGLQHARLHHQHDRRAARHRPRAARLQGGDGLAQRVRLEQLERLQLSSSGRFYAC